MKVVLTCGGTGGHIYPAIAIADKIKEKNPDAQILFIGTKKGMENDLVPHAGYEIRGIDASGFNRKSFSANIHTLENLYRGSKQAKDILNEFKPDIAIGTGGYVTGTVLLAAHNMNIKCAMHEQNAVPGVANKLISEFADYVFVSFKDMKPGLRHPKRVIYSGNPIRNAFETLDRSECRKQLGLSDNDQMVLATGGSLGAAVLNREVMDLVSKTKVSGVKIYFVTGKRYYEDIRGKCPEGPVELIAYADNMPVLMKAADIVISRAGAIAVSELLACGKASVLIPSPNVTNNHQYYNAKAIADIGAAVLLEEKNLTEGKSVLSDEVLSLLARPESLSSMSENARKAGVTDAAEVIYNKLFK